MHEKGTIIKSITEQLWFRVTLRNVELNTPEITILEANHVRVPETTRPTLEGYRANAKLRGCITFVYIGLDPIL